MNVLNRKVFVLNRNWQLIGETTVQAAIGQLACGAVTALDIDGDDHLVPVRWEDWLKLEPLNDDEVIRTQHLRVRMPTVIIAINFDKVPKRRPKFTLKNIAKRDGFRCQYTGKLLPRERWSMDHVIPKSRGGVDAPWNVVLADRDFNNKKGAKLPEEIGVPRPKIKNLEDVMPEPSHPHHKLFIKT